MKAINSILLVAVLLFATVITWTYFAVKANDNGVLPQVGVGGGPADTEGTDYRTQFQSLVSEHGNLAVAHLSNLYDGKDTMESAKKLDDNAKQLAALMRQFGTSADGYAFLHTFRGHIKDYENYTKARKANNQPAMNEAKEDLRMHAMQFGDQVHKLLPTISVETATQLMSDHMTGTLAIVDAHANGDSAKELTLINQAQAQAVQFANTLADGATAATQ
jgi:hypothetical protein